MRNAQAGSASTEHQDTLICLHGSAGSPRQWQRLGERLGPRYRVVAPGLIGYTDGAAWSADRPLTLEEEAAWIERWLDSAGAPVHLVGHSYGGAVAMTATPRWASSCRGCTPGSRHSDRKPRGACWRRSGACSIGAPAGSPRTCA